MDKYHFKMNETFNRFDIINNLKSLGNKRNKSNCFLAIVTNKPKKELPTMKIVLHKD